MASSQRKSEHREILQRLTKRCARCGAIARKEDESCYSCGRRQFASTVPYIHIPDIPQWFVYLLCLFLAACIVYLVEHSLGDYRFPLIPWWLVK